MFLSLQDCGKCAVTRTQCTKGGELLPKGIIVGTSDLQMRTLAVEDEDMVHHFLYYLCLHPCYCFLYIKSEFGGSFPLEFVTRMIVFSGSRWQVWCQSVCWHQCFQVGFVESLVMFPCIDISLARL